MPNRSSSKEKAPDRPGLPARSRLVVWARVIATGAAVGLLLPLSVSHLGWAGETVRWLVDLAVHWQWLYAPALLLAIATLVVRAKKAGWLAMVPLAALPYVTAAPSAPDAALAGRAAVFTVAEANVEFNNMDPAPMMAWLQHVDADVVVLLEVSEPFAEQLSRWTDYRHRKVVPSGDPFGIAVLSRHPLSRVEVKQLGMGIDYISASVDWRGTAVDLNAVHTMPPLSPQYLGARDQDIAFLAGGLTGRQRPGLMVGDLNATPWSSAFHRLGGLSRAGSLSPTWHAAARGITGIPIDHVLATNHWRVVERVRGPHIGSDHLPVAIRLTVEDGPARRP